MSAYVVDREHIMYLVNAALAHPICRNGMSWYHAGESHQMQDGNVTETIRVANILWQENIKSVMTRYPDSNFDNLPGPIGESYVISERDLTTFWDIFSPIQVVKACHCYEYQSCEHDGWEASEAHAFINSLEGAAIHSMPSYDKAEWGAPKPRKERVIRMV